MDERLVGWARAVKARRRLKHPVLWLFTDSGRLPDPLPAIARLPKGLCGVVFRHDGVAGRAALARRVAALCRGRRLALTLSGDWRLAVRLGVGVHFRAADHRAGPGVRSAGGAGRLATASAHTAAELRRAARLGALVFLSPVFPTLSHPGARVLGPVRWAAMARRQGGAVLALGGVDAGSARRLPPYCVAGAGAIGALRGPTLALPAPPGREVTIGDGAKIGSSGTHGP